MLLLFLFPSCTDKEQQDAVAEKNPGVSDTEQQLQTVDTLFCYIRDIQKTANGYQMKYDPIVFVMGNEALALIKKEHPEIKSEEEQSLMMLNDYYISNKDTSSVTGTFTSDIPVTMQTFTHDNNGSLSPNLKISTAVFFKAITADQNWRMNVPYIITRKGADITSITEQYIP